MFDPTDADTSGGDPFAPLAEVEAGLRRFCAELDPDGLSPAEAAAGIERLAALDRPRRRRPPAHGSASRRVGGR